MLFRSPLWLGCTLRGPEPVSGPQDVCGPEGRLIKIDSTSLCSVVEPAQGGSAGGWVNLKSGRVLGAMTPLSLPNPFQDGVRCMTWDDFLQFRIYAFSTLLSAFDFLEPNSYASPPFFFGSRPYSHLRFYMHPFCQF